VVAGGVSLGLTSDGSPDLSADAGPSESNAAVLSAVLESREDVSVSRSNGNRLLDAERKTELERQARAKAKAARERRERRERQRRAAEARRAAIAARAWETPMTGYRITSPFGEMSYVRSGSHSGIDLAAGTGTPVSSVASGTVVSAGYEGSYGNKVVLRHSDGTETWYCHLNTISVSPGQAVTNDTVVGSVGSTGNVTGPHLHLEVHPGGGEPVDPYAALADRGVHL